MKLEIELNPSPKAAIFTGMFSWKPIHEETALRLADFEERQKELIALLTRMQ